MTGYRLRLCAPWDRAIRVTSVAWCHAFLASSLAFGQIQAHSLALGSAAPAFSLPGVDGNVHTLADYRESKLLLVAFLCNHCTESQLYEGRIEKLAEEYRPRGVAIVAIQSSNPQSVPEEELAYTDVSESLADMKIRAAYRHFTFPYLYDGETQKTARAYGATVAPQVFLFDQRRALRYIGSIDDSVNELLVKSANARNAIDALLSGKPVALSSTKAAGCPIKGVSPASDGKAGKQAEPVSVAMVSPAELTKLRANGTGKLLLVNFYATWCGPCVSEFPDLMATDRMYRRRGFALTTVSSNEPEEKPDVLKFLEKMHAESTNLLFATADTYAMQAAFDPNMGPAVPFTVLIAPNGDIVSQQQGDLDMMELRRAILANLPDGPGHEGAQQYWSTKK